MTRSHPQDENTRELVKHFCHYVSRLKQVHYIYRELFDDDGTRSLMERTAHAFFQDFEEILHVYFLLEVAKLTDPATSLHGKRENFTVANLIKTVEWPSDCLQEIDKRNETVLLFRKYVEPARNRLLAHYDKTTIVSGCALGGFPEGDDIKLLEVLEQMCNVMHKAAFGDIFGDMAPYHRGDVLDLKEALRRAIAFDKLFSDSKGDDLMRLWKLLQDVDSGRA